jgi:RNA polymerase primary sigma factor
MDEAVRDYLQQIGQFPLLCHEQELELGKKIQQGDLAARDALINHNLRLVVNIVKKYAKPANLMDLIQEGNLGLIKAAERYDPTLGFRFSTYAVWWIKQAAFRFLGKDRTIPLPENVARDIINLKKASDKMAHVLGRDPMIEEMVVEMQEDASKIESLMSYSMGVSSLDFVTENDEGSQTTILDHLIDDGDMLGDLSDQQDFALLKALVSTLSERDKTIVEMRFGLCGNEPHTLRQIAEKISISAERVRQIEAKALQRLVKDSLRLNVAISCN